jgi:hypothetical protein
MVDEEGDVLNLAWDEAAGEVVVPEEARVAAEVLCCTATVQIGLSLVVCL